MPGAITVVGLGPAGPELMTTGALQALRDCELVFLRTSRHPSAGAVTKARPEAESFDRLYEENEEFSAVYQAIAEELVERASRSTVCYAVPGSPLVAEATVPLLRHAAALAGVELVIEPAVSFADLAFERLGIDPVERSVRLVDASEFGEAAASAGSFLVAQAWSTELLSELKLSVEEPDEQLEAVLLHHLGLEDEVVRRVRWSELDRSIEADHLTSLYVESSVPLTAGELVSLEKVVRRLRVSCPWDRQQTHLSLLRYMLEEAYEAMDALEALGADPESAGAELASHAEEELGDLLCQVFYHGLLGEEEGLFSLGDIARCAREKLVSRHPHVFGEVVYETTRELLHAWEKNKDEAAGREHLFEGIPAHLPALARAEKYERKLESAGVAPEREGGLPPSHEEAGDLLLALALDLAAGGIDPEGALRSALDRLAGQVAELEAEARADGSSLAEKSRNALSTVDGRPFGNFVNTFNRRLDK